MPYPDFLPRLAVTLFVFSGASHLFGETDYAVIIREPGTKKTYVGDGSTIRGSHDSRLFGVAAIDFSDFWERSIQYRAVLHARKTGKQMRFAPRPLVDSPVYSGTSFLVDAGGRTGYMDLQTFASEDPQKPAWVFPQGKASLVQLKPAGPDRWMALRSTSPCGFGIDIGERIAVQSTGMVFTLETGFSRELNALSPSDLLDARAKLIELLISKGWLNDGEDAY